MPPKSPLTLLKVSYKARMLGDNNALYHVYILGVQKIDDWRILNYNHEAKFD